MYTIQFQRDSLLPRERLVAVGPERLSNQELLAILLRTGTKNQPVTLLAHQLLQELDSLTTLRDLSIEELQTMTGIGKVKAIEMKAMIELGRRIHQTDIPKRSRVTGSNQLAKKMMSEIGNEKQEHLVALYLNTQNQILYQRTIFIGSVDRSLAVPREILHYGVKCMASAIIVVHNHPSGVVKPSQNDVQFTSNLKESCELLGLSLLDHIIVGKRDYFSFREEAEVL